MEKTTHSQPKGPDSGQVGRETKPFVYFYDADQELLEADASGSIGYVRSSFNIAILSKETLSCSDTLQKLDQRGVKIMSTKDMPDLAGEYWVIVPETKARELDSDLGNLIGQVRSKEITVGQDSRMSRIIFFDPEAKNCGQFLPPRITDLRQLFSKIILLSAVQNTPSIWANSLICLKYHTESPSIGPVFQDAYPFYFSPGEKSENYFEITSKSGAILLKEHLPIFPLASMHQALQSTNLLHPELLLTLATRLPEDHRAVETLETPISPRLDSVSAEQQSSLETSNPIQTKQSPPTPSTAAYNQGDSSSSEAVAALGTLVSLHDWGFDSFIIGDQIRTLWRDFKAIKRVLNSSDSKIPHTASETLPQTDPHSTEEALQATADRLPLSQGPRLSSGLLTNLSNLKKTQLLKTLAIQPKVVDQTILDLAREIRRANSLDSRHGIRVISVVENGTKGSEGGKATIKVLGACGLFSSSWGGLSTSDLAFLHGPLIETLQAAHQKADRLLTSKPN